MVSPEIDRFLSLDVCKESKEYSSYFNMSPKEIMKINKEEFESLPEHLQDYLNKKVLDTLCGPPEPTLHDAGEQANLLTEIFKDKEPSSIEEVSHVKHYNQGNIECIDAMISAFGVKNVKTFCRINAFKYLWRSEQKNGEEDIKKAIWYLTKLLNLNENKTEAAVEMAENKLETDCESYCQAYED